FILENAKRLFCVLLLQCLSLSLLLAANGSSTEILMATGKQEIDVEVTGTVVDETGEPIPGATVSAKGTSIGTATDLDGRYSLSVPEGAILVFSFIGFESQEVEVGNQKTINITLIEDVSSLEEVVVVGYGTQKRENLTGAVSTVTFDE